MRHLSGLIHIYLATTDGATQPTSRAPRREKKKSTHFRKLITVPSRCTVTLLVSTLDGDDDSSQRHALHTPPTRAMYFPPVIEQLQEYDSFLTRQSYPSPCKHVCSTGQIFSY